MKTKKISRYAVIVFVVLILFGAFIWAIFNLLDFSSKVKEVQFGVTFSHKYAAENLKLDW